MSIADQHRNRVSALRHFLTLAQRGKPGSGASTGEEQARKLALCIIENSCGLDDQAREGAAEFLLRAVYHLAEARILLDAEQEGAQQP